MYMEWESDFQRHLSKKKSEEPQQNRDAFHKRRPSLLHSTVDLSIFVSPYTTSNMNIGPIAQFAPFQCCLSGKKSQWQRLMSFYDGANSVPG